MFMQQDSVPNFIPGSPAIKEKIEEKSEKRTEDSRLESIRADPHLEPKLFFWDNIIFYLATAILGLSVSNIIVDFVRPEPNTVACYTAPGNTSRDQTVYINNYCNQHLPFTENFTLALVIHGAAILAPYYLWKAYFSARIDFFFTHAAKLETLRERDTGEYPHKNFSVVDYMHREFHEKRDILIGYIIKTAAQFGIALLSLSISAGVFQDFDVEFDCPRRTEHRLFGKVTCVYAKLRFIAILQWVDYALLTVSLLVLLYGLYWCVIGSHPELEYENTSQFCYASCINSKFYKATKRYRLQNDKEFLLVWLFATNTGLGRVFKSIQIVNKIRHELDAHFESLDNYDSMRNPQRRADMEKNNANTFKDSKAFATVIFKICKGIRKEQLEKYGNVFDSYKMGAMDIACGYHSYLFAIARWQLQVVTIILDPYYKNHTEVFKCEEHGSVKIMKIPTNLFGLPSKHKEDFAEKIELYTGFKPRKPNNKGVAKFSLVVIGPLDDERKVNTVNQIIEMHSRAKLYFEDGAVMLIVRPLEVEGKRVTFLEWKPESQEFWHESNSLCHIASWFEETEDVISVNQFNTGCGELMVKCGDQVCKFELRTYCHGDRSNTHTEELQRRVIHFLCGMDIEPKCYCCGGTYNLWGYYGHSFLCPEPDVFHIFCANCFVLYDGATCPIHFITSFYYD